MWLIVGPGTSAQVGQGPKWTVAPHNHVRKVDRLAGITFSCQHGCDQRLDTWHWQPSVLDIGQTTDKCQVGRSRQFAVIGTYHQLRGVRKLLGQVAADELVKPK